MYMIVAGSLTELKAFGAEAKFSEAGKQIVKPLLIEPIQKTVKEIMTLSKGSPSELQKIKKQISDSNKTKLIALSVYIKHHDCYNFSALNLYIETLSEYPTFKGLVIFNKDGKYELFFPTEVIIRILKSSERQDFSILIKQDRVEDMKQYPGVVTDKLAQQSTNIDALEKMVLENIDVLAVVGENGQFIGLVERSQIISTLLLTMAK